MCKVLFAKLQLATRDAGRRSQCSVSVDIGGIPGAFDIMEWIIF